MMNRRNFITTLSAAAIGTQSNNTTAIPAINRFENGPPNSASSSPKAKKRYRPIKAGVNCSNVNQEWVYASEGPLYFEVTNTDLGKWADSVSEGDVVRASNAHVYARSGKAAFGETIVQPGTAYLGNAEEDGVGEYIGWSPLENNSTTDVAFRSTTVSDESIEVFSSGVVPSRPSSFNFVGQNVTKVGHRTDRTVGKVTQRKDVKVRYSTGNKWIKDVLEVKGHNGSFIKGGDSGSPVYNESNELVGLSFAHRYGTNIGYVIPLDNIEQEVGVTYRGPEHIKGVIEKVDVVEDDKVGSLFDALKYYNEGGDLETALRIYNNGPTYRRWNNSL